MIEFTSMQPDNKNRIIYGMVSVVLNSTLIDRVQGWGWQFVPGFLGIYPEGIRWPQILYIPILAVGFNATNLLCFALLFPSRYKLPRLVGALLVLTSITILLHEMLNVFLVANLRDNGSLLLPLIDIVEGYCRVLHNFGMDWLMLLPIHLIYTAIAICLCFRPWRTY